MPPSDGQMCSRSRRSVASRVDSPNVWLASQPSENFRSVILRDFGSMYSPRSRSASVAVRNLSASVLRMNGTQTAQTGRIREFAQVSP